MPLKTVTVIGATGLVGGCLVEQLQQDSSVETVRVLVRRPVDFAGNKIVVKMVNFSDAESFKLAIEGSDAVFCAVGTTQKKVHGDEEAYRKVDYDIPVKAARFCVETKCGKFLMVSSVGANRESRNFYLRLKGEVEAAVQQLPIPYISLFRPSILLGRRRERRPAERAGQLTMKLFSFLLLGRLRKYKPVKAEKVAMAMIRAAKENNRGHFIFEYPF